MINRIILKYNNTLRLLQGIYFIIYLKRKLNPGVLFCVKKY